MDLLLSVNWIALLVLAITLLLFKALVKISYKVNWTFVILIAMVMGAVMGIVFASKDNSYLVWVDLIGKAYINIITALVAPVILISIMSGFISLNDKEKSDQLRIWYENLQAFSKIVAIDSDIGWKELRKDYISRNSFFAIGNGI